MSYTSMGAVTLLGVVTASQKPVDVERWLTGCTMSTAGVQANLRRAGYPVAETGMPNAETYDAMAAFRSAHNIPESASGRDFCQYLAAIANGVARPARPASWGPAPAGGAFLRPGWSGSQPSPILQPGWRPSLPYAPATDVTAPPPSGMSPALKYALIGGVGLLVAGGVVFMMRKKR